MNTTAERQAYVDRLQDRVNEVVLSEVPPGFGHASWDDLGPVEAQTKKDWLRFVEQGGDKRNADEAALALLLGWRNLIRRFKRGELPLEESPDT